ncbi:MAG: glycosyltransferase family 2 protein [Planctomycetota bacterium]|nr:glycosyltransferase family 2 protein [Planctomycetota bacterium]
MGTIYPKITVVTPSYNQGTFLEQTIRSVLCQDYPNLEYIVLDGGSQDDSPAIIRKYAPRLAYWRSQPDDGQAAAIDEGLRMATGQIMCWVNSDDPLAAGSLNAVAEFFNQHPNTEVVVGEVCLIDEIGRPITYLSEPCWNTAWQLYVRNCIPQSSVFWRRTLYQRVVGINPKLQFAMDYDLWFQFVRQTPFWFLGRLLSYQRHHLLTKTSTIQHIAAKENPAVARLYLPNFPARTPLRHFAWRLHRTLKKLIAGSYLRSLVGYRAQRRAWESGSLTQPGTLAPAAGPLWACYGETHD